MHRGKKTPDFSKAQGAQPAGLEPAAAERSVQTVPFAAHELCLSPREWLVAGAIVAAAFFAVQAVWQRIEPFAPGADYRIPYSLGEDYWLYRRYCGQACAEGKTLVLGDSVVWGHYVRADQTLSHYLNELAGSDRFANLGVDGIHPASMAGLVDYYGRAMAGKRVLLSCNLLWMTSDERDLRTTKEVRINHPRLLPQFWPRIPAYKEPVETRLRALVEHPVAMLGWVHHLRAAYFDSTDFAAWTLEHPRASPLRSVTLRLPSSEDPPPDAEAQSWTARHIPSINPPWLDLRSSIQWRSFRKTVEMLRRRGNRVFVLVGPFNEHMLQPQSLARYRALRTQIAAWLAEEGVPYWAAEALPSELYADASHPLARGYASLARQLWENGAFARFRAGD